MKTFYTLKVAGIERDLPLCKLNDKLMIAGFVIFGDVELTEKCAKALLEKAPEHDIIITPESKAIPLVYEMAKLEGNNNYVVARKAPKLYMKDVVFTNVKSITTEKEQTLCVGSAEIEKLKGKKVLIVDDVISTGASLSAVEQLVADVGGETVGKMAILAEGDAMERSDIKVLAKLPLFDAEGNEL